MKKRLGRRILDRLDAAERLRQEKVAGCACGCHDPGAAVLCFAGCCGQEGVTRHRGMPVDRRVKR